LRRLRVLIPSSIVREQTSNLVLARVGTNTLHAERSECNERPEAAMNNHRQLVFADLRDVSVFRRRLPIFAAHGYRPEERDRNRAAPQFLRLPQPGKEDESK
jgi:hypothetical protein